MNDAIPAYMIVQLDVKSQEEYVERYGAHVVAQLAGVGAEVVAVLPAPRVLEGDWPGNWTVVIRFTSIDVAKAWYGSEEYRPLLELRLNELTTGGNAVFVEGFDPAALGV